MHLDRKSSPGGNSGPHAVYTALPGRDLVEFKYLVCDECGAFRQALEDVDPQCPVCGHSTTKAPRTLTIPEFGFVADREPKRLGSSPAERILERGHPCPEGIRPSSRTTP